MAGYNKYKKLLQSTINSKPRNPELTLGAFSRSLRDEYPFISGFTPRAFWLRGKQLTKDKKQTSAVNLPSSDFRIPFSDLSDKFIQINKAVINDLTALEIDKTRDNVMASHHKIHLTNPYLEPTFVNLCLTIPTKYKLIESKSSPLLEGKQRGVLIIEKYIERLWGKGLNRPEKIVWRPKMAFQYSTQVQKLVQKAV